MTPCILRSQKIPHARDSRLELYNGFKFDSRFGGKGVDTPVKFQSKTINLPNNLATWN